MVNPRWTGFTHTAKAQMQCPHDLSIPSESSLNSRIFNAQLTNEVTHTCQVLRCCPKDFALPVQDESEVRSHDLSVRLLQRSQAGVR